MTSNGIHIYIVTLGDRFWQSIYFSKLLVYSNNNFMKILLDIGGTKMRVGVEKDQKIEVIVRMFTPKDRHTGEQVIAQSIWSCAGTGEIDYIVAGVASMVEEGVLISAPNLRDWEGWNLQKFLADEFNTKVLVENDASLAGLGEAVYGAGASFGRVFYAGLGTGLGGALIVDGEIARNKENFCIGDVVIKEAGGRILRELVSGSAIYGASKDMYKIIDRQKFTALAPILAIGLQHVIEKFKPEVLVLGGSLLNDENGFRLQEIKSELVKINKNNLPEIKMSILGDDNGLWGALAMAEKNL